MAYAFNGTSQYLYGNSAPVTGAPLTIACWFQRASTGANSICVSLGQTATGATNLYNLLLPPTGGIAFLSNASGSTVTAINSSSGLYPLNTWTHAAGVLASMSSRSVFINGASVGSTTTAATAPTGINSIYIGARWAAGIGNYFPGRLADVGVWNVALTAGEIATLAKGVSASLVRPQSLVFHAPLVRDLLDERGGLAITNNNGASVVEHPRIYA